MVAEANICLIVGSNVMLMEILICEEVLCDIPRPILSDKTLVFFFQLEIHLD